MEGGGSFITFMTGKKNSNFHIYRGYLLYTDIDVQMCAKKLLLLRLNINIIHE